MLTDLRMHFKKENGWITNRYKKMCSTLISLHENINVL